MVLKRSQERSDRWHVYVVEVVDMFDDVVVQGSDGRGATNFQRLAEAQFPPCETVHRAHNSALK